MGLPIWEFSDKKIYMIQKHSTNNEERNNFKVSISSFVINNIHEVTLCQIQVSSENFNLS